MSQDIIECPACDGSGMIKDILDGAEHYHPCRCCTGLGAFPASEMLDRVKDFKTWPDSVRRDLGIIDR